MLLFTVCGLHAILIPLLFLPGNATREYNLESIIFRTQVRSGMWKQVKVGGKSLYQYVSDWYENVVTGSLSHIRVSDNCSGILCNTRCPDQIFINYSTAVVFTGTEPWVLTTICIALIVACFTLRVSALLCLQLASL